jgi:hypothetical protein
MSISATFGYGLVLLLVFLGHWGLKVRDYVLTFNNNELSSTMLLHNHLMKGVNALFMGWFGAARQENADAGLAFIGLLPSAWYWVGMILFVVSAVFVILKFIEIYELQTKWRSLYILVYSMISFSMLKNMLDGGIMNTEAPIAISAFILILLLGRNQKSEKKISYFWSLTPLVSFLIAIFILKQNHLISIAYFYTTVYAGALFITIAATFIYWQFVSKRFSWIGLGMIVVMLVLVYSPLSGAAGTYINSRRVIGSDGGFVALYQQPHYGNGTERDWKNLEKIKDIDIYEVHPEQPTKINELLLSNRLLANLLPINLPGITCNTSNGHSKIDFTLVTQKELPDGQTQHRFANLSEVELISSKKGLYKYRASVLLDACAPRPLNLVQEVIRERGLESFFVVNISEQYNIENKI